MLNFLLFALVLLTLALGPALGLSRLLGWGLHRHPVVTSLAACVVVLLLACSFTWLFPGCVVTGLGFHGVAAVYCLQ